ncbi:golgin subfamily B member 1 isoform X1 [Salmo trutta]|uniref:golgin subfamily B member 1 isoform X1 n=1 Tax=Salmo trutta TaxID=8032 RepID=UPI0011304A46|nr:golgin subfamily B member 1-like isoform X1 [Salmo trutta]
MLKWFSNEDGAPGQGALGSPQGGAGAGGGEGGQAALVELAERLAQTEQLVSQLKELIREKDGSLRTKDEQLKAEKEACEAKLSKMRLQNKAKVTSLSAQLEELKKGGGAGGQGTPTHSKKGAAEGSEQASRGKILLLRKKVEELEHQLSQRDEELEVKSRELEDQRQRGADMDAMLVERNRKLSEKEAYIVHLQMGMATGEQTATPTAQPDTEHRALPEESGAGSLAELQLLVLSLTRKVGEGDERYSLLQEQTESLKELLVTEKAAFEDKENMYKQNIQTFKDIILQKDNKLTEVNQMHEQELFKLAAKSDASADLEQLLKALKQKLHEKEVVLQGKNQVIDVLQGEVDSRDQQIKDLVERARRLQVERESLGSKMEAEKHVMRAQLRDLLEKHQGELRRATECHEAQLAEQEQALRGQLQEELGRTPVSELQTQTQAGSGRDSPATAQRMNELEAQAKLKSEEASKSEAKFLKMKAWSKSRIRQLEDELRKSQSGRVVPNVTSLRSRITDLEEEREETLWKLEQYDEIKAKNDVLEAKLVVYEEQQRKMASDLEQVTKRAASQASESGSADDAQSQVLDWQEMVSEAVTARDRAREEKATMALRMSHMEEEREGLIEDDWFFPGCSDPALASRQQELEEELVQARGLTGPHRSGKKMGGTAHQHSLQEDFEFDGKQAFHQDPHSGVSESTAPMEEEGENMGGWWPEYTSPNTGGLRSVVEELELERNQLQEQILGLEDRCQDLEDRLQLQARIESLQNESERLQGQLVSLRSQQSRDAEKHHLLVTSLNEQLKGLSDTQECLETSLIEKENTLVKTSEKLELIDSLRDSLKEKEAQHKEVSDKLLQSENNLTEVSAKCSTFEKQCSELKTAVADLTHKLSVLKEKTQKQEATIKTLKNDLDQTNDELDKLNTTHLEERSQLIHNLQSCEREIDNLRDVLSDKDKEILALSGNMAEYAEQIMGLKREIKHKDEDLVRIETALTKSEREAQIIRDSQNSDHQALNTRTADLVEQLKDAETELSKAKEEKKSRTVEVEELRKQVEEDKRIILELRGEIQQHNVGHRNHLLECETQISSLKENVTVASQKLQESEGLISQLREASTSSKTLKDQLQDKEQTYEKELKSVEEERHKLRAEVSKHNDDLKTLSNQLEKQTECHVQLKKEVQEKLETISSLEEKLRAIQEEAKVEQQKFNTELQVRDSEKEKLTKDLQVKLENISNMKKLLKNLKTEKQQLQADLKEKADELKSQKQLVDELNKTSTAALELNSSLNSQANGLREENQRLQQDVAGKQKSISEMTDERDSLRSKVSNFETQHSENSKVIEGLLKDKVELSVRANELNKALEQNKQSISESLFEKTNECSLLTKTLREKEETVARLQVQIDSLNTQVEQFHHNIAEKEKSVTDQNSQVEAQQSQLSQLQETMYLLQEQVTALKTGLTEKDTVLQQKSDECSSLQNKLGQQKKLLSKLQGETKSLKGQCSQLTQRLEEKEETFRQITQDCESHKDELNKRNESLKSLSSQLGVMNESSVKLESENTELKTTLENHEAENNKLRHEMEQRQAEVVGLHSHFQALSEQNQQLRAAYEIRDKELAQQMQVTSELDRRVNVTLEQNTNLCSQLNSLTEEKQIVQQELAVQSESISELTKEKNLLLDKLSNFEMQHSENCKIIDGLLKDKKELSVAVEELNKVLEQNKQTISESLLDKTNKCTNLTKLLRGSEEALEHSQDQVDSLITQLDQLNNNMTEKEKTIRNQNSQLEAQQRELSQLQETLALLQEQGTALKSGLTEKDTMLQQKAEEWSSLQNKLNQLQGETKSLEGQCSQLTQRLEEKEETFRQMTQDCENHKDELNQRNESLKSLSSQLGVINECSAKLESENTELKTTLENHAAENKKLREEMEQRQTEILDLRDNIQALHEQNVRLKTELKNSVTEASKKLEEISVLRAEISKRDSYVSNLTKQLTAACSDRDSLGLNLQQSGESLNQLEMFIKQLQAKSVEGEGQMSQAITELQTQAQSLQKSLQDKDVSLHEAEKRLSLLREKFTLESEDFKTQLNSNAETMKWLQGDLRNAVEQSNQLSGRLEEQEAQLKQKVDDYVSLRTYVSELEDSTTQLRGQVDSLTSESSLLKETLKEKVKFILEAQSTSSAVSESLNSKLKTKDTECESLKEQLSHLQESVLKLNTKDAECESLKEQLSHLQESVSKLNSSLSAQSSEVARLQQALEERGTAVMDQSKALQELQRRADEAALFKTQFMESTELVSQLQGQIQELSTKSASLSQSAEENQSAFVNLQEKYAAHLEELQEARTMLFQRAEEMSSLNKALSDSNCAVQAAENTIEVLRNESSLLRQDLRQIQTLNVDLSKQKEDALETHQRSTSTFTVEIERLKSQYLHVAAQVNALTENLEQREMSLHAINSQYTAQVKQAEHVVSEMNKLEEQNKKLREEIALSKQENQQRLDAAISEKERLQQEVQKLIIERDEHGESYSSQIQTMQEQLHLQKQQQSSSMNEVMEKMVAEKERLQVEVSVKGEEITGLKSDIQKIGKTLQDSEKEWLSVLDRETQDKNIIAEQLKSVENEIKSKDIKVQALKQDLDSLHEKLAEAATAIRQGSDLLKAKEVEASTSRVQIENILVSVQEKDKHNIELRQALQDMESELRQLEVSKECSDKDLSVLSLTMSDRLVALEEEKVSLQTMLKQLRERHQCEVDSLRGELNKVSELLKWTECTLNDKEMGYKGENQQNVLLQEKIQHLHAQLQTETENLREAGIKQTALLSDIQTKDEQVSCMTIQISHQKELLAGLSQQLREKDASVAQVIESASNERMKYAEENSNFLSQLESLENAQSSSMKQLENMSLQLEESKAHLSRSQSELETKDLENGDLVKERDNLNTQLTKLTKEKEVMKKKLQAALVVRKELLKKLEDHEHQIEQNVNKGIEISGLQDRLQELTLQAQATTKEHEDIVADIKRQVHQKEGEFLELAKVLTVRDSLVEYFEINMQTLQAKLDEQEASLTTALHNLNEKSIIIDQLNSNISEKEEAFEQERSGMMLKLEKLQEDMKKSEESLKEDMSSSSATAVDIENELTKVKQEKAMMQKKAQAALLARKETIKKSQESEKKYIQELSELKDDYKALLEQHCQQTNDLNAVQLSYDQKVSQASVSQLGELETLRLLVQERDKTLQDLNMSLSERESQVHASSSYQAELETLHFKLESMSSELANKDKVLIALEQKSKALSERMSCTESQLKKAHAEIKEKMEELARQQQAVEMAEQQHQQEKQTMVDDHLVLQNHLGALQATVEELKHTLEALVGEKESQSQKCISESKELIEDRDRMKGELENALTTIAQQSSELQILQNTWAETQQQLGEEKEQLKVELEKAQSHSAESQAEMESHKLHMESLQQEKESAFMVIEQLNCEVAMLDAQLKEAGKVYEELLQKIPGLQDTSSEHIGVIGKEVQYLKISPEEHEMSLKERDDALVISQALATEKEELIAALEQQLQRQIHLHEVAMEKMRTEVDELQQRSQEDASKTKDQGNQSKTALLTRKLQAALVSRKEILKDNSSLKEQMRILSAKNEEIGASSTVLEMSVTKLKQQKEDLESSVSSLSKEKEKLIAEVDRILNDNHNLSAACESLKLTIENITQQKQAFSCQLESLKDSQTDELSEWKSKHTELKQEYESLLQAYENVSSEMDKMRQLLEGARRERQEALFKANKSESERENLEKQVGEMEDENEKIKEKMRKFTQAKQQKMEELEEENKKIRIDLLEFDDKQKVTVEELTIKNNHLEAEIHSLVESSEALRRKLTEIQLNNGSMAEALKEATCSLEKWPTDSKACEQNIQLKLDDALILNNSLTAQIKSQKTELASQQEINKLMQKEKETLSERIKQMQNKHEKELGEKDDAISELQEMINRHSQETISLNEKVRILEDDKSILQEELENVQEISDKVKNENEYLEMVILKNSERIDELTETVNVLQAQNTQLSSQLTESKEKVTQVCQEKEEQQLKLVKEFEEKLKMFQRGNEGSRNIKKELQELLKEKHHEINHLQHDSIKYQELILDLERSLKSSESAHEQVEKELREMTERISSLEEGRRHLEAELTTHKNLLNEAKKDLTNISSEKDQLVEVVSEKNNQSECQVMERTKALQHVAEQQKSIFMEREVIFQQHIEELLGSKERESQVVLELKRKIDSQDLQMNTLTREADTNLAKLAALSSSPHGTDAVKQWNDMFLNTLHEKDSQLLEQGFVITRFLEDIRVKEKEITELQVTKSRLERTLGDYTVAATAQQRQLFIMGASNRELNETVELLNQQLQELSEQVERLEQDRSALNIHLTGSVDSTSKMEFDLQQLENTLLDTESQLLLSQSHGDMLQVAFEKQEAISLHLKSLLQNKDAEISSLLSSRDGQMSGYLEQLQANHRAQVEGYEDRLTALYYEREKADKEFRRLENKVKSLQMKVDKSIQEKEKMAAQMGTFRNSMVSLQTERERLMSEYRMSEARNQTVMQGKEGSAEGDLSATKGLKHEIRTLLHQMDDLNSENAMLRAQLIRYREDLNQVLSLKDSQLKELLRKQQDAIKNLENQKATAEKQNRKTLLELEREGEASDALKAENSKLQTQVTDLEANILALNKGMQETNKGKVIADLQHAVAAKAAECNDLQQKLFAQKVAADDWKGSLQLLQRETEEKLGEAEDKYNSELDAFEQEVELMRNEKETADQRVAELARDLMQTEQLLSNARVQSTDLKSQNESLGKAMAALQNDRDQLIEDFKILRNRYDKELRETQGAMTKVERHLGDTTSELATLAKERHILVQKLSALESKDAPSQLTSLVDELSVALSEKEGQFQRVSLENDTYSSKVSAFSRSMASLQDDRDRLMEELAGAKRAFESRQGLGPEVVGIANTGESNSHRSSGIQALQTGRDGLETKQRVDELQSALQQAQAFKLQTETEVSGYQAELAELRSESSRLQSECQRLAGERKETMALVGKDVSDDPSLTQLQAERTQLQSHLQRCLYEIQQRDLHCQQLNAKLQQVVEEKGGVSAQLRAVSQTLRDTQNRCYWLENQALPNQHHQGLAKGAVSVEVAPGAPQERSSAVVDMEAMEAGELRTRLVEMEQSVVQLSESLAEERTRREAAEEALGLAEDRAKSVDSSPSRTTQRDFSIQLDTEEEWEALILNPNEPLVTRKVKGGMLACRRWLRGRSLYCSKLLTSRARSRYLFLGYLLILHVAVLMCLTGAL